MPVSRMTRGLGRAALPVLARMGPRSPLAHRRAKRLTDAPRVAGAFLSCFHAGYSIGVLEARPTPIRVSASFRSLQNWLGRQRFERLRSNGPTLVSVGPHGVSGCAKPASEEAGLVVQPADVLEQSWSRGSATVDSSMAFSKQLHKAPIQSMRAPECDGSVRSGRW